MGLFCVEFHIFIYHAVTGGHGRAAAEKRGQYRRGVRRKEDKEVFKEKAAVSDIFQRLCFMSFHGNFTGAVPEGGNIAGFSVVSCNGLHPDRYPVSPVPGNKGIQEI